MCSQQAFSMVLSVQTLYTKTSTPTSRENQKSRGPPHPSPFFLYHPLPSTPSRLSFPLEVCPLNPAMGSGERCKLTGSGAEPQPKSNFVHFSLKISHLIATISVILLRISRANFSLNMRYSMRVHVSKASLDDVALPV